MLSQNEAMSPSRVKRGGGNSPVRGMSPMKRPSAVNSPKKQGHGEKSSGKNGSKEEQKGLSSPTSVSMYNSFIIKNADESFDSYYHSMKKRKQV